MRRKASVRSLAPPPRASASSRTLRHAACTALPTLAMVIEPPCGGVRGSRLSGHECRNRVASSSASVIPRRSKFLMGVVQDGCETAIARCAERNALDGVRTIGDIFDRRSVDAGLGAQGKSGGQIARAFEDE